MDMPREGKTVMHERVARSLDWQWARAKPYCQKGLEGSTQQCAISSTGGHRFDECMGEKQFYCGSSSSRSAVAVFDTTRELATLSMN